MKKIFLVLLFLLLTFLDAYSYAHTIQNEISNNVIRLHIIANSDTSFDQELKLKVRDSILEFMKQKNYTNLENAFSSITNSIEDIKIVAKKTLIENGCFDNVEVELGEFYFPAKNYDSLSFPAGMYNALRIKIGNAAGKNWWCVMYPTLCFSGASVSSTNASNDLKNSLSEDSFSVITQDCKLKFKIVDFFNTL